MVEMVLKASGLDEIFHASGSPKRHFTAFEDILVVITGQWWWVLLAFKR
jgi:hypothetical protein